MFKEKQKRKVKEKDMPKNNVIVQIDEEALYCMDEKKLPQKEDGKKYVLIDPDKTYVIK